MEFSEEELALLARYDKKSDVTVKTKTKKTNKATGRVGNILFAIALIISLIIPGVVTISILSVTNTVSPLVEQLDKPELSKILDEGEADQLKQTSDFEHNKGKYVAGTWLIAAIVIFILFIIRITIILLWRRKRQ